VSPQDELARDTLGAQRRRRAAVPALRVVGDEVAPALALDDFYAFSPTHQYIFAPTGDLWTQASVNARLQPVRTAHGPVKPSAWLDKHRSVEQVAWIPGHGRIIEDMLMLEGGLVEHPGARVFNLYRPPMPRRGDPAKAGPYLDHVRKLYPEDAGRILRFFAHCVQSPGVKINHGMVLGGPPGIGKDTMLQAVIEAVGSWNCSEISPAHLLGRFNGYVKSVILRVSEARDQGDVDRYKLHDHTKVLLAAPPLVHRVDEKNKQEYGCMNTVAVILTTNHRDSLYLPPDDRRHYVAWSELTVADFDADYFPRLYRWFEDGGYGHVAAWLSALDLSDFDPKAAPPKTPAFWAMADANRAPEDAELADLLDRQGQPDATTIEDLAECAGAGFGDWLRDRRNRKQISHRLESAGYVPVRNDGAEDGLWKLGTRRQVIYAKRGMAPRDRFAAASLLVEAKRR
jgi:hypothetical protein